MNLRIRPCCAIEPLEPRRLLSGLTLITHGYQSNGLAPQWIDRMAEEVARRIDPGAGLWTNVARYTLQINAAGTAVSSFIRTNGPAPASSITGEAVIVLDWAAASNSILGNPSAAVVAQTVASALTSAGAAQGFSNPGGAIAYPMHVIGHSRGAALVSDLARQLGRSGIVVDHVTTLDPYPLGADPGPSRSADIYDNVVFADNYYQNTDFLVYGSPVNGAQNTGPLSLPGGASLAHSDIHTYYHGTIGRGATTDGDVTINPAWYTSLQQRATTGFDWSRVSGGTRPASGLAPIAGGSASRVANTYVGSLWPNVMWMSVGGGTNGFVANGESLTFNFRHQAHDNSTEVDFYLDDDTNIFNGFTQAMGAAPSLPQTGTPPASLPGSTDFLWNSAAVSPGAYYVTALITDGTGKVRVSTFPQQLFVSPEGIERMTKRWSNDTGNHLLSDPRNVSPGGTPGPGDRVAIGFGTANIDLAATGSISLHHAAAATYAATRSIGRLSLADSASLAALGGGGLLLVNNLSLNETSRIDLSDNAMIVDYTGVSPLSAIRSSLVSGYNNGAWNGIGIRSSAAAANQNQSLGYAEAATLFSTFPASFLDQAVDSTAILIRHTLYGDADLNGTVDGLDFNRLAPFFGQTGTHWTQGNFNYDNITNGLDFNLLAPNFGSSLARPGAGVPAGASPPEPAGPGGMVRWSVRRPFTPQPHSHRPATTLFGDVVVELEGQARIETPC